MAVTSAMRDRSDLPRVRDAMLVIFDLDALLISDVRVHAYISWNIADWYIVARRVRVHGAPSLAMTTLLRGHGTEIFHCICL